MATREAPPPGLLEGFSAPLWERLRLDRLRPLSIVRGQHRGHDWMAIELEHGSTGLFSTGAPSTDTVGMTCPWCLSPHHGPALPPAPTAQVHEPVVFRDHPPSYWQAAHTDHVWCSAHARAPPTLT